MADKKEKSIKKGFPMGIKVNDEELITDTMLDEIIELTECYHGGHYIIGHDTQYCQKPHHHIHWFAVKDTSEGAMKTFRSDKIKKKFPHISRSFRFYVGQDLPDAKPQLWLAYAIKETQVKVSGFSITDDILIGAKSQFEIKQMKQVHSQKKANEQKEKQDFKQKMLSYVFDNYMIYAKELKQEDLSEYKMSIVRRLLLKFLMLEGKFGSMKKHFVQQYYLEFMIMYGGWDESDLEKFIFGI